MNNELRSLASRKLTAARDRAMQAQRELHESVTLVQDTAHQTQVTFRWAWKKIEAKLLTDEHVQNADYLGALQITDVAAKTNGELLRKAVEATKDWVRTQQDSVAQARKGIEEETRKRDAAVRAADEELIDKHRNAQNGGSVTLPEKKIPSGVSAQAMKLFGLFAGVFVGRALIEVLAMLFPSVIGDGAIALVTIGIAIVGIFGPTTWGAHLMWIRACKRAVSLAESKAQEDLAEIQQRHPAALAAAESELAKQLLSLEPALAEAEGRLKSAQDAHSVLQARLAAPCTEISHSTQNIETISIPLDKIGLIIGAGAKTIKNIMTETGANIVVEDEGKIRICSADADSLLRATQIILEMTKEIEVGGIYQGRVVSIKEFGCFVEVLPGKEGLCHISELAEFRVDRTEEVVKIGDKIWVKCIGVDDKGRVKLSRKAAMKERGTTLSAAR